MLYLRQLPIQSILPHQLQSHLPATNTSIIRNINPPPIHCIPNSHFNHISTPIPSNQPSTMCCSPEKRALKAQRKLDRAQRRMDSKAAKYAPSCLPATHNYAASNFAVNNYPTTFDPVTATAALRLGSQEQGRGPLPNHPIRALSTDPPSYGAMTGSEYECHDIPVEKSGITTDTMLYASTEHACCAGTCGRGGCGHGACGSGRCQQSLISRAMIGGCG